MTSSTKPQEWTKEPWSVTDRDLRYQAHPENLGTTPFAFFNLGTLNFPGVDHANAKRAAECVNFLAGHPDLSTILVMPKAEVEGVRVEQVEAACVEWCRQINRKYPATLDHHDPMRPDDVMREMMRAALTAALGKGESWIACGERMPPRNRYVLIAAENSCVPGDIIKCSATYDPEAVGQKREWYSRDDGWSVHVSQCGRVTHWRPLPPPPTTISEEGT